ncbi:unnamed protein product [Mytilus coruscus]|uniref:Uncharacterized protein n=1 Tax=Mytilus coruscus TaxID=42192 RepID=A0A6J8E070_MYTCO|nr:unnamed protein product [Mytilus coruscus]
METIISSRKSLAAHMTHSPETADRHYNLINQRNNSMGVTDLISKVMVPGPMKRANTIELPDENSVPTKKNSASVHWPVIAQQIKEKDTQTDEEDTQVDEDDTQIDEEDTQMNEQELHLPTTTNEPRGMFVRAIPMLSSPAGPSTTGSSDDGEPREMFVGTRPMLSSPAGLSPTGSSDDNEPRGMFVRTRPMLSSPAGPSLTGTGDGDSTDDSVKAAISFDLTSRSFQEPSVVND